MKKKLLIILTIIALAGFVSSCGTSEDCPAYDSKHIEQAD